MRESAHTASITQRLQERLPHDNAGILHRVVQVDISVGRHTRVLPKPTETIDWKVEATEAEFEEVELENRTPLFRDRKPEPSGKPSSGVTTKAVTRT